jgi:hypothetical protein
MPAIAGAMCSRANGGISRSYDAEALRINLPTHDVERFRPGVLAAHFNCDSAAIVSPKHTCSRAIAEQRRGDDVRLGQLIEPESESANFDHDEQYDAAWTRAGEAGGNGEAGDAAGAAKSKDGNPLDIGAKPQASGDPCLETGRCCPRKS